MITITGINLTDDISQEQLSLFGADIDEKDRCEKMELTMDQVRRKYGSHSIGFASVINNDLGIEFKGDGDGPAGRKDIGGGSHGLRHVSPCIISLINI